MQVVGIVGASFCGSTIFSAALSTLPGVIAPGEIHWLIDPPAGRTHKDFLCYHHREACTVVPPDLWRRATPQNAHALLAEVFAHLAPRVLVSSDKSVSQHLRYARLPEFYILLTRQPLSHVVSLARSFKGDETQALEVWRMFYLNEINRILSTGRPFVHIEIDEFAAAPLEGLRWLSGQCPLFPAPARAPEVDPGYCHIGGNMVAYQQPALDPSIPARRVPAQLAVETIVRGTREVYARLVELRVPRFSVRGA